MKTKTCIKCKEVKSVELFNRRRSTWQSYCRECDNAKQRERYQENKKYYYSKCKNQRNKVRQFVDNIKKCGCKLCDEKEICCLEFHHLFDKEDTISLMVAKSMSLDKIILEIKKCVVLCSNCHRKVHAGILIFNDGV
jgi:hypothetical protein